MIGWIALLIIYGLGCVDVHMTRRDQDAKPMVRFWAVALWPVLVLASLISPDGIYSKQR